MDVRSGHWNNYVSLRLGTVFGWAPNHRLDLVVNRMVFDAVTIGEVTVNGNAARPLTHIEDVASAVVWAVEGDATGVYNVVGDSFLAEAVERLRAAADLAGQARLYEAGRMLFGFVTDVTLRCLPAFGDYDAVSLLTTGMRIETSAVLWCLLGIGITYPILLGVGGWLVFERRDLVRPST